MKIKQIKPLRLFHYTFKNQYDMCMTFLRIQEFYESPKFRGTDFSLEEYMDWYVKKHKTNVFTYTSDWLGFNVPGNVIYDFYWMAGRLSQKENDFFDRLNKFGIDPYYGHGTDTSFYVIGSLEGDEGVIQHEIRHAWFYLVPEYRKDVIATIKKYRIKKLRRVMKELGYVKNVIIDEINAYVLTGLNEKMTETKEIKALRKELKSLVKKHGLDEM